MIFTNEEIIEDAFDYFRRTGFTYRNLPVHVCKQEINKLANTDYTKLINTYAAYQVADTYHPHRFHAPVHGMKSPHDGFMSDKILRRSLERRLVQGGKIEYTLLGGAGGIAITSGVQGCSNFRPGMAAFMYRTYCSPGDVILDTSTGYGGRLVGYMASGIDGRYVGFDPNRETHRANKRMAKELGFEKQVSLTCKPIEDVELPEHAEGWADFAFTSPPYFSKEHYSEDDTQSWVRYKTGIEWKEKFLQAMLTFQYRSLRAGKFSAINVADVKIGSKSYPLMDWTIECAKNAGFNYDKSMEFKLVNRIGTGNADEVAKEPILIFQKPDAENVQQTST